MNLPIDTPRRRLLRIAGAGAGAGLLAYPTLTSAATGRRSTVEVTEGPFFVDERLRRSDIRVDPSDGSVQTGLPLALSISVSALDTASGAIRPLHGVMVDLWHCDRLGVYSDVDDTAGRQFLRGYQVSDGQGRVAFQTVFPGWYDGRAPHIHCKLRGIAAGSESASVSASTSLTTQFFFDEALTRRIYADPALPYRPHGLPNRPQSADGVYSGTDGCEPGGVAGDSLTLAVERRAAGAFARFDILVDTDARCLSRDTHGPGGPGGPGMPGRFGGRPPDPPSGRRRPTPGTT